MKIVFYAAAIIIVLNVTNASQISIADTQTLFKKAISNELSAKEKKIFRKVVQLFQRPELLVGRYVRRSLARTTLDCIMCRAAATTVVENVRNGLSFKELMHTTTDLCTNLQYGTVKICRGYLKSILPVVMYIIRHTPEVAPETFCGMALQKPMDPDICPFNDPRFDWVVDLPDHDDISIVPRNQEEPELKVVILTDTHIDPQYEPHGVADCDEPICCRKGQKRHKDPNFQMRTSNEESLVENSIITNQKGEIIALDLSVVPELRARRMHANLRGAEPAAAGYWGDYRNCDTPIWAFEDILDTIAAKHKDIDALYYIGDTIHHRVWESSNKLVDEMNKHMVNKIRTSFGANVLVLPTIGNHDTHPTNQFAPQRIKGNSLNTTWLYQTLADKWGYYLSKEASASFRKHGDYSIMVRPGLRVISLNNNVAYKTNWWLIYNPLDAKSHLDFLVQELHKAERAGEKVHILTHISPGYGDLIYTWTREYNRIVNRFSRTIAAEFNGHVHVDEFKIFYDRKGTPINVAWGGGCATSYSNVNLNYKVVTFSNRTFVPNEIENYSYNLTEANLNPMQRPNWRKLYDMKQVFRLNDLSPVSMDKLIHDMVTDKRDLFELYAGFWSSRSDTAMRCDEDCKLHNLCNSVVTVLWETKNCDRLKVLFRQKTQFIQEAGSEKSDTPSALGTIYNVLKGMLIN